MYSSTQMGGWLLLLSTNEYIYTVAFLINSVFEVFTQ